MGSREASILVSYGKHMLHRGNLQVHFSQEYDRLPLPETDEALIDQVWAHRTTENPTIYNASKFRLHRVTAADEPSHDRQQQQVATWDIGLTCYKDFLGTNWSPKAADLRSLGLQLHGRPQAFMADPLGVGSLVLTSDGGIVLLKRSMNCAEAPGVLDIPGGHPEPDEILKRLGAGSLASSISGDDVVNELFDSALREIRDETNIPLSSLSEPAIMGVALNELSSGRPSCEFLVRCSLTSEAIIDLYKAGSHAEADESTAIQAVPVEDVLCLDASPLWSQLAPSAKGCFLLYASHFFRQ